jgi:aspartyl/asparaginyl beta-hydroxylase (cupin superfamily)
MATAASIQGRIDGTVKSAIAAYYQRLYEAVGGQNRPVFFDVATTAPALLEVQRNYPAIKKEVEALLSGGVNLPRYHEVAPGQERISAGEKKWKVFIFDTAGARTKAGRALCPATSAVLDKIPNLFQAFFSILEAGKSIPAHNGPFYGAIRYHLGLLVPRDNPPSIRIKDQFYTWKEGEGVLFDDTWNHEVFNASTGDRVILLVDVLRPLPWHLHVMNRCYKLFLRAAFASKIIKNADEFR